MEEVAIVTGGSRGIGRSICHRLSALGFRVAVVATSEEGAAKVASELQANGGPAASAHATDVSDPAQVDKLVDEVLAAHGRIDALVNNAGITRDGLLLRMKDDDFDKVMRVNLYGPFFTTRAVSRPMLRQRKGSIVNLVSVVGLTGNAGQANYAASKAGLVGFTKSAAKELAGKGIRVNAVAPGYIATDMTSDLPEQVRNELKTRIPCGRIGTPEEVSGVVGFLCSEDARYVTGQVLTVDGGMVM